MSKNWTEWIDLLLGTLVYILNVKFEKNNSVLKSSKSTNYIPLDFNISFVKIGGGGGIEEVICPKRHDLLICWNIWLDVY